MAPAMINIIIDDRENEREKQKKTRRMAERNEWMTK